jgi:hypothetical protein
MFCHFSMIRKISVVLIACWGITSTARAQDFKIYTPLFDMNAPQTSPRAGQRAQPEIVGRSQSFFHAGKAYDSQSDQQVLIYEPNAQRFTILNTSRGMATTISFEDIEKLVRSAEEKAQEHVLRAKDSKSEQSTRNDMIEFQLQPSFKERFDRDKNLLTLKSAFINYEVKCATPDSPERFEFYLKYCDWMARLNYLLQPQAPLPGPRLTLNGSLRKHKVMPTEVTLQASIGAGINLKAEHKIYGQLEPLDRERIHQWQTALDSEDIQYVPFTRFREIQLADKH